jgi:hypothetical protein
VADNRSDAWDRFWSDFDSLKTAIAASPAINVNASSLRNKARDLVQLYFREARPTLVEAGIKEPLLASIDQEMQRLLELSHGRNPKKSYKGVIGAIGKSRSPISGEREKLLGRPLVQEPTGSPSSTEVRVLGTLREMLPEAASSYEQALVDLQTGRAHSWRGTSVELREVVREVLDHLATDDAVAKSEGFKVEKDRRGPTMKRKAAFVFRSRGLSTSKRKTPQEAISIVDELTAAFVRSIYERGSGSTHGAPTRDDVEKLKMYVDIALVELLETSG